MPTADIFGDEGYLPLNGLTSKKTEKTEKKVEGRPSTLKALARARSLAQEADEEERAARRGYTKISNLITITHPSSEERRQQEELKRREEEERRKYESLRPTTIKAIQRARKLMEEMEEKEKEAEKGTRLTNVLGFHF
ncbi:hypothetical protein HK104_010921 [Borealophlyctis nickersoniae]|nr:hypothetical protein HK104_010921 [Borealophlyctis nickersoniae]